MFEGPPVLADQQSNGHDALEAGIGGLLLYNVAYITPLVVLLLLASRPGLIRYINRWHLQHATATKAVLAGVVLLMGFAILIAV